MTADLRVIDGGSASTAKPPIEERRTIDLDAEAAVISDLLIRGALSIDEIRHTFEPSYFVSERHRRIYEAALAIRDRDAHVDVVVVASELKASRRLQQVGGMAYLTEVLNGAPACTTSSLRAYARTVRDLWVLRQLGELGQRIGANVEHSNTGAEVILAETRTRIEELAGVAGAAEASIRIDAVAERASKELYAATTTDGSGARTTGFDRLDRVIAGLSRELTVLGGRPGTGKTALATAIAVNVARRGAGSYVASLETSETPLFTRLACAEGRVNLQRARTGTLRPSEWSMFTEAARVLSGLPIFLDTASTLGVRELWSRVRRAQLELARDRQLLELVVVDYVQLLQPPRRGMPREQAIAENVRGLKAMAQEFGVTVLGLAQLNRKCEQRDDKRPQLSDLRESGEIEQCARTVLLIRRREQSIAEILVAKQNNGPAGVRLQLGFEPESTGFWNLAEGEYLE